MWYLQRSDDCGWSEAHFLSLLKKCLCQTTQQAIPSSCRDGDKFSTFSATENVLSGSEVSHHKWKVSDSHDNSIMVCRLDHS